MPKFEGFRKWRIWPPTGARSRVFEAMAVAEANATGQSWAFVKSSMATARPVMWAGRESR